jgi:hypothetical protein
MSPEKVAEDALASWPLKKSFVNGMDAPTPIGTHYAKVETSISTLKPNRSVYPID